MFNSGVDVNPKKVRTVETMKEPSSLKEVTASPGLVRYNRNVIPVFGKTADFLDKLFQKSNTFERRTDCKGAVTEL